ncbi:hypothetical protein [Aquimarina brevivitae]|uniref:Uncharacterized protein n=1 Tax=Aquimarina brevivitae TaxID=323412 RepID=A0A4Q7NZ19_9FLAO|nr:hypothetical protein [Aquimarina brevivitae]RZS92507.1 hypothetical protein EV197_2645 [Aquimarina brevivitae]
MPVLKKHISIPKKVASEDDLDFFYLKEKGIEYIEELGSRLWTDYNTHDPGITILEMLSYAITDLGMRINLPIENLLASDKSEKAIDKQFYKASDVLPTSPITALDYRKLFIDIDGVKNCWLAKHKKKVYANCKDDLLSYNPNDFNDLSTSIRKEFELKGLYDLYVDYDDNSAVPTNEVNKNIRKRYNANRNLCEDLVTIKPIGKVPIKVCADIEVDNTADEELVHALLLRAIEAYFSTTVNFYSLKQMMDKGYNTLQIFDGPVLEHGFIDQEELIEADLRSEVRLSDIMSKIMDIPGVKNIKDISLGYCGDEIENGNEWIICLDAFEKPELCDKSVFNYNKGLLPLNVNMARVQEYLDELEEEDQEEKELAAIDKELEIPKGKYLKTNSYTTIQNDFPDTYGISQIGLPARATTARKAKAKQLKAYLLFFDQILASYFKHLGEVKELLSVSGTHTNTFFTQAVKDLKGIEDLINDYPMDDDEFLTHQLFQELDNNIERRNKILDHLLARFAERFSEYTFIMKAIYADTTDEVVLRNKEAFLKDYRIVSKNRGKAFNYYKQPFAGLWNTDNVSGVQKRIARLLGIKNYDRRSLSDSFVQIYSLINSDNEKVYRWRIRDVNNNIILSATEAYYDLAAANRELYFSVLQIIQTSEFNVNKTFEEPITDHAVIDNIQVHISDSGKYSFDIINPMVTSTSDPDRIIAKQFLYYDTQQEVKQAILDIIKFFKEDFTEEGIFIVEHILLRPDINQTDVNADTFMPICTDGCTNCEPIDPYSYRISIVIPGYTLRFSNTDFRNYMERIIKEELPAHVLAKICWVGYRENDLENKDDNELFQFEKAYKNYLLEKTNLDQEQPEPELLNLIKAISDLNNVYPTGRLFDCDDENEELYGRIILGKTNLGSL